MADLIIDWLEGENAVFERDGRAVEARRAALVTGITPGVATPIITEADPFSPTEEITRSGGGLGYWAQASAVLPRYGDPHPEFGNLIVYARRLSAIDRGHARADILYRTDDELLSQNRATLRISSGLETQTIIPKQLTGPPGMEEIQPITVNYQSRGAQAVELEIAKPAVTAELEKLRSTQAPLTDVFFYAGTVNAVQFLQQPERTWLCSEVAVNLLEQDSGDDTPLWRFRYRFELNKDTWDQTFAWIDPATGRPPPFTPADIEAEKTFNFYPQANFNDLQLGWT